MELIDYDIPDTPSSSGPDTREVTPNISPEPVPRSKKSDETPRKSRSKKKASKSKTMRRGFFLLALYLFQFYTFAILYSNCYTLFSPLINIFIMHVRVHIQIIEQKEMLFSFVCSCRVPSTCRTL